VLVLAVLAASCAREDTSSTANTAPNDTSALIKDEGTPVAGGSLTIGMPAETPGWNQHDEQWPYWSVIEGSSVLEPLATVDKDLNVQFQLDPSASAGGMRLAGSRPEIDRCRLRQLLAESLPEGMIRWGHRLVRVEEDKGDYSGSDGDRTPPRHRLVFGHTTVPGYDRVVGATARGAGCVRY
jgi:hypothetical protein